MMKRLAFLIYMESGMSYDCGKQDAGRIHLIEVLTTCLFGLFFNTTNPKVISFYLNKTNANGSAYLSSFLFPQCPTHSLVRRLKELFHADKNPQRIWEGMVLDQ